MRLTAKQVRILSNAAYDATPSYGEDGEDGGDGTQTGNTKVSSASITEEERRRHRQALRKNKIKPNKMLAERLRKEVVEVDTRNAGKPFFRKASPESSGGGKGLNSIVDLIRSGQSSGIKVTQRAKRLAQLGRAGGKNKNGKKV